MWSNRWVKVGAVALGMFLINGIARLLSFLTGPDEDSVTSRAAEATNGDVVISVVGALMVVALLSGAAVWWSVRYPVGRVVADLGFATIGGALLALLIGPFLGGNIPLEEGLETFVYSFLQFLGLGALGIILGFAGTVVAGKDWRSRGLAAYAERHGKRAAAAQASVRKR